jgi:hypothetical protein
LAEPAGRAVVRGIVRPLSWIVTATSLAAFLLGARMVLGRRVKLAPPPALEEAPPAPTPTPPHTPARKPPALLEARPAHEHGLAHVRGRVVGPGGVLDAKLAEELEVEARDGKRRYEAETGADATFELHLPARHYTLTALAGDLIGEVELQAKPGASADLVISLQPAAAIEGVLHLPGGADEEDISVEAFRAGTTLAVARSSGAAHDRFFAEGLVPGALYDLVFSGTGRRPTRLTAVRAPASDLEVTLTATPVLRGAIGFRPDGTCPLTTIELHVDGDGQRGASPDEDTETSAEVDRNCTFRFESLPDAPAVVLAGSSGGWHVEEQVAIPSDGDPPFVCLNPPCRELPPAPPITLTVRAVGAPADASIRAIVSNGDTVDGCATKGESPCQLSVTGREDTVSVTLSSHACANATRTLTLHPGANELAIPCTRMRLVQGTVREPGGTTARNTYVRCGPDHATRVEAFLFHVQCPADQSEITYQSGENGRPHHARLPPGLDPVLLDLTL